MRRRDDLAFPMVEYDRRLADLRERMRAADIDVMLTTTPENICYLTGFDSPGHYWFQGLAVPLEDEPFSYSRLLETSGVEADTWIERNIGYHDSDDIITGLAGQLLANGYGDGVLAIERESWFFPATFQERLFNAMPDTTFVDASGIVEAGRLIKSPYEVDRIRRAAAAGDRAMQAGLAALRVGATENDVAAALMAELITAGSHWPAIVPFVASGERGAIGHATWKGRELRSGDTVFLELAGCLDRYHAPQMRTAVMGRADPQIKEAFEVVCQSFDVAMEAIRPGVSAGEVDRVCRAYIAEAGFGENQGSRTAYSVGISLPPDWGEGNILSMKPGEGTLLAENMTFHLLPWVQIPGKGGVGCTETILVTADGAERLTCSPRVLYEA